jgi:hypothetical protein
MKNINLQESFGDICAGIVILIVISVIRPYGAENTNEVKQEVTEKAVKQSKVLEKYGELITKNF